MKKPLKKEIKWLIDENQSNLPIELHSLSRTKYMRFLADQNKLFIESRIHQTDKHTFKRILFKPFL